MTDTGETVLVTGGTGTLGRHLVHALEKRRYVPRVMSRSEPPRGWPDHREWARADLSSGEGLEAALQGVESVLHAATSSTGYREVDVEGTREHLLPAARSAWIRHLVFPAIVGADEIPFGYYDAKVEIEEALHASDVPSTVTRATQFHSFVHPLSRIRDRGLPGGSGHQSGPGRRNSRVGGVARRGAGSLRSQWRRRRLRVPRGGQPTVDPADL